MSTLTLSQRNLLIEENLPLVDNLVACLLKRRHIAALDRDDLIQDGRIGLIKAVDSFDDSKGTNFRTWATTKIISAIRDALRPFNVAVDEESFREEAHGEEDTSSTSQIEASLTVEALLPRLPENQRQAVKLHYLDGHSYAEVGRFMGVSRMHAGRLVQAGLQSLREIANAS